MQMRKLKMYGVLFLVPLMSAACQKEPEVFWPEEKSPDKIAGLITEDLFSRSEFMMYITDHVTAPHYSEVGAAIGVARYAGLTGNTEIIERLTERYMRIIEEEVPNTANHVDANVYGALPLELYMHNGNEIFYEQGITLADSQWVDPWPNGLTSQTRYWIDDVWMIGMLQTQAYRATGDRVYLNRAAKETVAYLDSLQQPNGLFHHGPEAPFYWGRGNGWVASGLTEIISVLPADHPDYPRIVEGYKAMMNALLQYQAEDGMWRQLINEPESWKETSSTAMFGYSFVMGVKRGILSAEKFRPAYQKAWLSLVEYMNEEGKMTEVCAGTGQSRDINYYLERPRITGDFHGQAPAIWFAAALQESR